MKVEKTCPVCGKVYYVWPSEEQKYQYCSVECRKMACRIPKICIECGKDYFVYKDKEKSIYCSKECEIKHNKSNYISKICPACGKTFAVRKCEDKKYTYCSVQCRAMDSKIEYNCDYCGKPFLASKNKIAKNTRGVYCSSECSEKSQIKGKFVRCDNCGKIVYRTSSKLSQYDHTFCSNQCNADYNNKSVEKICEYCGKHYIVQNERSTLTRFCSNECKNQWQSTSENCGINNPRFRRIQIKCSYCGKEFYIKRYRLSEDTLEHFCCYDCRNEYYKIIENRTEKQRALDIVLGKNAIKYTKPTLTAPHKKVLDILDKHNVNYEIEYLIKYYKLDIYLKDYNLSIEVQGDFWHCSPIRFKTIDYEQQLKSINRDKSKHTYVKRYYDHEILYLWEKDINNNSELCELLIGAYINHNGILENYHSFNYNVADRRLNTNDKIIIPFQNMPPSEISKYLDIKNAS